MADVAGYAPSAPRPPLKNADSLRVQPALSAIDGKMRADLMQDPYPGALGGEVGGIVDIDVPYDAENRFQLTLYVEYTYPGDTSDDTGWVETGEGLTLRGSRGTRIKFRFVTPPHPLPSGPAPPQPALGLGVRPHHARWVLRVRQIGARRSWEFEIQVNRNPGATLAEVVSDVPESGKTGAPPIPSSVVYCRPNPNWLALSEISGNHLFSTIVFALFGLGCIAVAWKTGAWGFFVLGVLLVGLVVYTLGMRNDIAIMQGGLLIRRLWFGFELQKRSVAADNIVHLRVNTLAVQPAESSTWSLDVSVNNGRGVQLVAGLNDSRQAYVLRRWIDLILKKGTTVVWLAGELPLDQFIRKRGE